MAEEFDVSPLAWLKRVLETQDEELSCSECQELVSQYVHIELETGDAAAHIPRLAQHLMQYSAYWDSFQILRELSRLEAQEGLPNIQELTEWLEIEIAGGTSLVLFILWLFL